VLGIDQVLRGSTTMHVRLLQSMYMAGDLQ
jgi:hypothetical protein